MWEWVSKEEVYEHGEASGGGEVTYGIAGVPAAAGPAGVVGGAEGADGKGIAADAATSLAL